MELCKWNCKRNCVNGTDPYFLRVRDQLLSGNNVWEAGGVAAVSTVVDRVGDSALTCPQIGSICEYASCWGERVWEERCVD